MHQNKQNKATRKAKKAAPEQVSGISEQFGDGAGCVYDFDNDDIDVVDVEGLE